MQEPRVDFYFQPRRDDQSAGPDDANGAPGLVTLPTALLERHGARVLNPENAVALPDQPPDQPPVRSTVYRARTLLVPDSLQRDAQFIETVNTVLGRVGMSLVPTISPDYSDLRRVNPDLAAVLQELPRVAVLKPARRDDETAQPRVVDAWVALQTLREAASAQKQKPPTFLRRRHVVFDVPTVATISLEHLLISSSITGSGAHGTGGGLTPSASNGGGGTGPAPTDSYTFFSGDTRIPVAVCLDPPERRDGVPEHGRRPVVAVLDTGIREHPWLDVAKDGDGYKTDQSNGFVMIDPAMQGIIRAEGEAAETGGDRPRQVIEHAWDQPVTADPLIGELDTDTGHCTFISGIVRQVAPDARVLAIRIMHSDGIVNEGDILCALAQLAARVAIAEAGDMNKMVDVVSLSLGYFSEAGDAALTSGLKQVIDILLDLGVTVVAAAGNYSTSRRFYPAAFASQNQPGQVPVVSVGALNPNRSQAAFSDGGRWINAWACGAIMISTFPVDVQGSLGPEIRMRVHPDNAAPDDLGLPKERAALDPDDYRGGFAAWSGTSFSAPLAAARIAKELLRAGLRLDGKGRDCARKRAVEALKNLDWKG
jgi:subtilisin family serine protease